MGNYWRSLREAGIEPVDLCEPGASLQGCAGLLLTGGRDIDPARYGEAPHPATEEPNLERDDLEFRLLERALAAGMPVLAICRGHQLLNVALGGSLQQHIEGDGHRSLDDIGAASRWHEVDIEPCSGLRAWLGVDRAHVNSRHHQAVTIERLAPGLRIAGLSPDGFVEAVESERHSWVVGVQWHPERLEPDAHDFVDASRRLFAAFAVAVRGE
jgi:putative glutamine amidotransferase